MNRVKNVLMIIGTAGLLGGAAPAVAQFTVTTIPASLWGADDESIGLGGGVVEDFEDYALAPGFGLRLSDTAGAFAGPLQTALPALFDPVNGDPYGDSFSDGVWDGAHVLLNIPGNESVNYGSLDFRSVELNVPAGAAWLGVAMQQVTGNHELVVNGQSLGRLSSLDVPVVAGRNGLMVVTADDPETPVVSVSFGGRGDAFCIDHVVFMPAAPVSVEQAGWGSVKASYLD